MSRNETRASNLTQRRCELFGLLPESLSTFPSRPIRIDVNSAGLLARASSDGSCLPSARGASGVLASLLRAYSGGAAPDSHRIPIQNQVVRFIRQAVEASQAYPR